MKKKTIKWEVIADFPGSYLSIGDIIESDNYHKEVDDYSVEVWISDRKEGIFPSEFPALFKRIDLNKNK